MGSPALCDTALLIITVNAVNDAPVASNDTAMTNEDVVLSSTVGVNATDFDNNFDINS